MSQPGLNFTTPRTGNACPASSHHAEQHLRESGAMRKQREAVEWLLREYNCATAKQLASLALRLNIPALSNEFHQCHSQIMRRLADLKNAGLARRHHTPGERESRWFCADE